MMIIIKNKNLKIKTKVMIKKQLIMLSLSLFMGMTTFAQKSELKAADKALKKKDYSGALAAISQVESIITNADAKSQAKFYYIKGMALYANGANSQNNDKATAAFATLLDLEKKGSGTKYSASAGKILNSIIFAINDQAAKDFNNANVTKDVKGYKKAADGFYKVYQLSPNDTTTLYSSAYLMYFAKEYQLSIDRFKKLQDLNYTGISVSYIAKSAINGKEMSFGTKKQMDQNVRMKVAVEPRVEKAKSKINEITKFIALNFVGLGMNDKALEAIAKARKASPNDYNLIIDEANIYHEMGNNTKYTEKVEEALVIEPNNSELHYNIGTLSMDIDYEKAEKHLLKAIELKSDYGEAYSNMGNLILGKKDAVQKEMDDNGMNFAKYDQIKEEKLLPILKESLPYLEKAYELKPTDFAKKQLNSLYENLEIDKKVE